MEKFKPGEKVSVKRNDRIVLSDGIIKYWGSIFVIIERPDGSEGAYEISDFYFERNATPILVELGNDLVASIQNAAWINKFSVNVSPALMGPTPHMQNAINNWNYEVQKLK